MNRTLRMDSQRLPARRLAIAVVLIWPTITRGHQVEKFEAWSATSNTSGAEADHEDPTNAHKLNDSGYRQPQLVDNDACIDAAPITVGTTNLTNIGSTTDGPEPCAAEGSDVWYEYTAPCDGILTVDTFGSDFDTVLAAYDGCYCGFPTSNCCRSSVDATGCDNAKCQATVCSIDAYCCEEFWDYICAGEAMDLCGSLCDGGPPLLACNDDWDESQSMISFVIVEDNCYSIQVGGYAGLQGSGMINLAEAFNCDDNNPCTDDACDPQAGCLHVPVQCPEGQECDPSIGACADVCQADLSDDGVTNAEDLALLLAAWGPNPGHPADFNDDGQIDASDLAELLADWGECQ